ncbi:MAG TPA: hypothetical protein VLH09_06790 [Bryobacteraceae bacterium]|nr:hypothetical protein [Bryobacteraceae bacterium]
MKAGNWVIWYDRTITGQPICLVGQILLVLQPGTPVNKALLEAAGIDMLKYNHELRGPGQDAVSATLPVYVVSMPSPTKGQPYLIVPPAAKLLLLAKGHSSI